MKQLIYTLSFIVFALVSSCTTKEGAPGPAGATGATGPSGTTGATGLSDLEQQGTINGTLSYVDVKGKNVSFSFDYQYFTSNLEENSFSELSGEGGDYYEIGLNRTSLKQTEDNNFFFYFSGDYDEQTGKPLPPTNLTLKYYFSGQYADTLFVFQTDDNSGNSYINIHEAPAGNGESVFTISNYTFDIATGQISFDYEIDLAPSNVAYDFRNQNSSTRPTIKGAVSAKLLNVPPQEFPVE